MNGSASLKSLVSNCRTIHAFENGGVREEDILEALELSLSAPNHKFTFPWRYVWPGSEQKNLLADLLVELKSEGKKLEEEKKASIKAKLLNPEIIVFCQEKSDNAFQSKEDYATMSCSVQLFALALAEKGLGYKWSTGKITGHPETYKILGIDPLQYEIIGFIFVGHAAKPPKTRKRPDLSEVLVRRFKM